MQTLTLMWIIINFILFSLKLFGYGLCNLLFCGKVQLKCVKPSDGGCYYAFHQPVLGRFDRMEFM